MTDRATMRVRLREIVGMALQARSARQHRRVIEELQALLRELDLERVSREDK